MPTFDFKCSHCSHLWETTAGMREMVAVCPECQGPADRQFSVNIQIHVPNSFRFTRGWHLPPKDHPSWEKMQPEGTYKDETQHQTLRQHMESLK